MSKISPKFNFANLCKIFLWYLFASRQTSRICFSCEVCFVDVDFALAFVLLIGIGVFGVFIFSVFVRRHSIGGPTVDVPAVVVAVGVVFELWSYVAFVFVTHSYFAAIDFDSFSLARSNEVLNGGENDCDVAVEIGDSDIGGSGRCSMPRFIYELSISLISSSVS